MPKSENSGSRTRTPANSESQERSRTPQHEPQSKTSIDQPNGIPDSFATDGYSKSTFEQHASLLGDSRLSQRANRSVKVQFVQQLQRDYGNRYLQRLVNHISSTRESEVQTKRQQNRAHVEGVSNEGSDPPHSQDSTDEMTIGSYHSHSISRKLEVSSTDGDTVQRGKGKKEKGKGKKGGGKGKKREKAIKIGQYIFNQDDWHKNLKPALKRRIDLASLGVGKNPDFFVKRNGDIFVGKAGSGGNEIDTEYNLSDFGFTLEEPDVPPQPEINLDFPSSDSEDDDFGEGGSAPVYAKLTVGAAGNRYEQEADYVAEQVIGSIHPERATYVNRLEASADDIQGKSSSSNNVVGFEGGDAGPEFSQNVRQAQGGGQPLDDGTKENMEQAFGTDFSNVRIHTGARSDELNDSVQSRAFTTGQDIFIRQEEYRPDTRGGQKLLAHELTHVVQQGGGSIAAVQRDWKDTLKGAWRSLISCFKPSTDEDAEDSGRETDPLLDRVLQLGDSTERMGSDVAEDTREEREEAFSRIERRELLNSREALPLIKDIGNTIENSGIEEDYDTIFDRRLREAMQLILGEENGGLGPGVRFGGFWQAYDGKHWRVVQEAPESKDEDSDSDDEPDRSLVLISGRPSAAIDLLFADVTKWAFDCADAMQVARWYAMRHAMGAEEFDATMGGMRFTLRSHESTGLRSQGEYSRIDEKGFYNRNAVLKFKADGSSESREVEESPEEIIQRAPVGTRLLLTCDHEEAVGTDYENENVMKVGENEYAAHPMGIGTFEFIVRQVALTGLDLDERDEAAGRVKENEVRDFIERYIYISEIELIEKR